MTAPEMNASVEALVAEYLAMVESNRTTDELLYALHNTPDVIWQELYELAFDMCEDDEILHFSGEDDICNALWWVKDQMGVSND